jgi:hypothetical protein
MVLTLISAARRCVALVFPVRKQRKIAIAQNTFPGFKVTY